MINPHPLKDQIRKTYGILRMPIKWPYIIFMIFLMGTAFWIFYAKIENFIIFFPQSSFDFLPERLHLRYRDVYLQTTDGETLHGWFFPLEKESPVILFFHGNAGNISHRLDNISLLLRQGFQVFIFDYRGFGKSSGRPSEKGLYMDGLAAYEYLTQEERIPPDNVNLFGRSLGAAVAIDIATRKEIGSLIIESAFTSTKDMAKTLFLFNLLSPFLPANYNNLKKITKVHVPKLVIHSEDDEIVPFSMGKRLFNASKAPKQFYPLKGATHNDTYHIGGRTYFRTIAAFVKDAKI